MFTVETLESRRMLAVDIALIGQGLYVVGDNNNNGLSVETVGQNLVVKQYQGGAGYQQIFSIASSSVVHVEMWGYDGNDTLMIHNNVTQTAKIIGGRGGDYLQAGGGTTSVFGQGDATSQGTMNSSQDDNAADILVSGAGTTYLFGNGGNDSLHFNATHVPGMQDTGDGGAGNDTFHLAGTRAIIALGQGGHDRFYLYSDNPAASVVGGSGNDTVDYTHFGQSVTVSYVMPSGPKLSVADRKHNIADDIEVIYGSPFGDHITGNNLANNLFGQGGDDLINGNGGVDLVDGGDGNDALFSGNGNDVVRGGKGNDGIDGGDGNDIIMGNDGNDSVWAQGGNDTVYGGNGNDTLRGEGGNDQLYGDAGHDHLYAGSGYNKLVGGSGSDYLHALNGSPYELIFGDNENGTGANASDFDVAVTDWVFSNGTIFSDYLIGIEVSS